MAFCFSPVYYYRIDNAGSIMHKKDKTQHYLSVFRIAEEIIDNFNSQNRVAESLFAINILSYEKKQTVWDEVNDKQLVHEAIVRLSNKAKLSNLKWMSSLLFYLRLPEYVMESYIGKAMYKKSLSGIYRSL